MENNCNRMPLIGDKAPHFEAETTMGTISFPEDYKGGWTILFSHPSDFTAVCTSELVMFGAMQEEFEALGCKLVGLSVGTVASHIAWLRSIHDRIEFGGHSKVDIRFPLVADMTREISGRYGMIQPGAASTMTVRAVFVIDPDSVVRAIVYYPAALGRNFDEIKRIVVGLQTADRHKVGLPADWRPGDDIIAPAPTSYDGTTVETADGATCYDWYFCMRPLEMKRSERRALAEAEAETGAYAKR